jgi:hypothetical protein
MINTQAVHQAELAIAARKRSIVQQWESLRARSRNAVTQPATLGGFALAGVVIGWRSGGRDASLLRRARRECSSAAADASAPGMMRSLLVGLLGRLTAVATEEILRSFVQKSDTTPEGPSPHASTAPSERTDGRTSNVG